MATYTFEELKRASKELLMALDSCTDAQVLNGVKMFNIIYLSTQFDGPLAAVEQYQAPIVLTLTLQAVMKARPDAMLTI